VSKSQTQIVEGEHQDSILAIVSGRGRGREVVRRITVTRVRSGWSVDDCEYRRTWPKKWAAVRDATERAESAAKEEVDTCVTS